MFTLFDDHFDIRRRRGVSPVLRRRRGVSPVIRRRRGVSPVIRRMRGVSPVIIRRKVRRFAGRQPVIGRI